MTEPDTPLMPGDHSNKPWFETVAASTGGEEYANTIGDLGELIAGGISGAERFSGEAATAATASVAKRILACTSNEAMNHWLDHLHTAVIAEKDVVVRPQQLLNLLEGSIALGIAASALATFTNSQGAAD